MLKSRQSDPARTAPIRTRGTNFRSKIESWLDRPAVFSVLVAVLVIQALWIALSARFPQAFDENFHLGLIRLHAEQWLPFFTSQPQGADIYGAVSRDPSYLYHYLLSLPYRLMSQFTSFEPTQVICLRLINIAMFVTGLYAYRKVFNELGIGRRMQHVVLLFFVLTPVAPFLAGQINYDNLIFPITGLTFLYAIRYLKELKTGRIAVEYLLYILALILLASIVKYTSLPISLALIALLAFQTFRQLPKHKSIQKVLSFPRRTALVVMSFVLLLLGGLFLERIVGNVVLYQSPSPDCAKVLSIEQCKQYSPWARDHLFSETYAKPTAWGIFVYPGVWVHRTVFETMFVITSRFYGDSQVVEYWPSPPLTVANYTAWTIVTVGFVLLALFLRRLWQQEYLRLLLLVIGFYVAVLFLKNFSMYLHTGEAVAIHGRYLVPIYPILYLALALAFAWGFDKIKRPQYKTWLLVLTLLAFLHGAGLIVWIYRSTPDWYWSQDPTSMVMRINQSVQSVVHRVIIP